MRGPDPVQSRPLPRDLINRIRLLAALSRNIRFTEHAFDRMEERGITTLDTLRALRAGRIEGEIAAGRRAGEWICKVVERQPKARALGVVTVVVEDRMLRVVTVEWEDR